MTQNSGGLSYQLYLGRELLNYLELNGYLADTPSRALGDKTFTVDTATLFELWNDQRRIAGGRVAGLQGKLALTPLPGGTAKLGFGGERLTYDYLTGSQSTNRLTGGAEWQQKLGNGYAFNLGGDSHAAESRYTLGLTHSAPTDSGGSRQLGIGLTALRGRDGTRDDNQIKLSYTATFDGGRKTAARPANSNVPNAPAWGNLLDQVALRPLYLPLQAVAKLDTTATPTRLIAVDKTALPSGATLDPATGNIASPLTISADSITGVLRNGVAFVNAGQFALASNGFGFVVNPKLIEKPAVGRTDTYVVTLSNKDGTTTLVSVVVSHGSVKIDSISVVTAPDVPASVQLTDDSLTGLTDAMEYKIGEGSWVSYDSKNPPNLAGQTVTYRVKATPTAPAGRAKTIVVPPDVPASVQPKSDSLTGLTDAMEYHYCPVKREGKSL